VVIFVTITAIGLGYRYVRDEHRFMRNLAAYSKVPVGYIDADPLPSGTQKETDGSYFGRRLIPKREIADGARLVEQMLQFFPRSERWNLRWVCFVDPSRKDIAPKVVGHRDFYGKKLELSVFEKDAWQDEKEHHWLYVQLNGFDNQGASEFDGPKPDYIKIYERTGQVTCPPASPPGGA
jgi:hypothetical protein